MFRLAPLVLRNIFRNRRRSLLTLASSAVSLALLAMLLAIYQGFFYGEDATPSDALRVIVRHRVSLTQSLPSSHQAKIASVPGVEKVSPWTWFQGKYGTSERDFFARFGVDPDVIFDIRQDLQVDPEQAKAFRQLRTAGAIHKLLATKYKMGLGDTITIRGDIYPVDLELKLAAIFDGPAESTQMLLFNREYLNELLIAANARGRDTVGTYILRAKSADAVPAISKAIDTMFENTAYPTRTESEKEFGRSFLAFLGNIKLFLAAICGAVTFTILLVSANTVAMAVRERTREMAILRTIGYTPGEILQLVLAESVVISVGGAVVGVAIGAALVKALEAGSGGFPLPGVKWQSASIVVGVALLVGVLAAIVPAVGASRKNVVESLRFTG